MLQTTQESLRTRESQQRSHQGTHCENRNGGEMSNTSLIPEAERAAKDPLVRQCLDIAKRTLHVYLSELHIREK